jgi:chemotaxis response regulator CheB
MMCDGYNGRVTAPSAHADRSPRRSVVVGASAGGVQALTALVSKPDPDLARPF